GCSSPGCTPQPIRTLLSADHCSRSTTDARESLHEPNALFWRGIWMTLF
ncbi:hypothetical protein GOD83_28920, partial [Sinorhizobium medicae]|nr:hypothetical protein [Sinorhizobium medicae]MDX0580613.1 hypothetical protein [Sinorhizobium medicae]MDX0784250.1 hypothetical protein [Sinorhizobium medicae]